MHVTYAYVKNASHLVCIGNGPDMEANLGEDSE